MPNAIIRNRTNYLFVSTARFFFLSLEIKLKYYIENLPSDLLKINDQSMKSLNLLNRLPLNKNNVPHMNITDTFAANAQ